MSLCNERKPRQVFFTVWIYFHQLRLLLWMKTILGFIMQCLYNWHANLLQLWCICLELLSHYLAITLFSYHIFWMLQSCFGNTLHLTTALMRRFSFLEAAAFFKFLKPASVNFSQFGWVTNWLIDFNLSISAVPLVQRHFFQFAPIRRKKTSFAPIRKKTSFAPIRKRNGSAVVAGEGFVSSDRSLVSSSHIKHVSFSDSFR